MCNSRRVILSTSTSRLGGPEPGRRTWERESRRPSRRTTIDSGCSSTSCARRPLSLSHRPGGSRTTSTRPSKRISPALAAVDREARRALTTGSPNRGSASGGSGETSSGWSREGRRQAPLDARPPAHRRGDAPVQAFARHFGVEPERGSQPGYDLTTKDGERIQVKGLRRTRPGRATLSTIRKLESCSFDSVIAVVFEPDFSSFVAWKFPREVVERHGRWSPHVNGHLVTLSRRLLSDPDVEAFALDSLDL